MFSGKYGPYVKHGDVNATIPKSADPATLSLDDAVAIIAERVAKGGLKPAKKSKAPAKKAAVKAPAKASAKKKAPAKTKAPAKSKAAVEG